MQDEKTTSASPVTLATTRALFVGYFIALFLAIQSPPLYSTLSYPWFIYLGALYLLAEWGYNFFRKKNVDLTYAFPLLFAIFVLNATTELLGGQERLPLLNRTEHFPSHVFLAYVVWTFFTQYLPRTVWKYHQAYTAVLVFSVTSTFGVINEIAELIIDALFDARLIGDGMDTPLDLLMNTLGAGLFLAVRLILGTTEQEE